VEPALHPDVEALARLLGRWSGEGEGHYPTIEPFSYREEISFGHVGKPFLAYRQATVRVDTGMPAHAEMGYLRGTGPGRVELVMAHPTGVAEVAEGTVEELAGGLVLRLHSTSVTGTATAKEVLGIERSFTVAGDVLSYDLSMAAVGQPLQHHLHAELHRLA
jgi:hypothetical protein